MASAQPFGIPYASHVKDALVAKRKREAEARRAAEKAETKAARDREKAQEKAAKAAGGSPTEDGGAR
jgi:hypothetical protein